MKRLPSLLLTVAAPGLLGQSPVIVFHGKAPNAQYGSAVACAGDVDGDGRCDLIVGAPIDSRGAEKGGAVEVRSGATGALLYTWLGAGAGDELGFDVAGAGDVDGDGYADLLVGVLGGIGPERSFIGHARVYSGRTGSRLHTFRGRDYYDFYGLAVAGARDLDADGHADVAIGAPGADEAGRENAGRVDVFSGRTGALLWSASGEAAHDQFGWSIESAGDLDGDTVPELIVGAPGHLRPAKPGYVRVHCGRTGRVLHTLRGEARSGDRLGWSVAGLGDVDGDGRPDVLCGAPFRDGEGEVEDAGAAWVFSGADGRLLRSFAGTQAGAQLGWCVARAGDVDGDGRSDAWVCAVREDDPDVDSGVARLFSAATGALLVTLRGRSAGDESGFAIADLGALPRDTRAVALGARSDDVATGEMVGTAILYHLERADGAVRVLPGEARLETVTAAELVPSELPAVEPLEGSRWWLALPIAGLLLAVILLRRTL